MLVLFGPLKCVLDFDLCVIDFDPRLTWTLFADGVGDLERVAAGS